MSFKTILAIETSCDDTAIAIIRNGQIIANVITSSTAKHQIYGGIVPEVAARSHEEHIAKCYQKALKQAKINDRQIDAIAYTCCPGLLGSIHVGKVFATSLAYLLQKPLIPINHLLAHAWSATIDQKVAIKWPVISLVVSGGHTSIYLFNNYDDYKILNETTDDAAGEVLDKIGRKLNLPYPGGISIDQIYCNQNDQAFKHVHKKANSPFSFSGFKTFVLNQINITNLKGQKINQIDIASSTLRWICDEIVLKLQYYIDQTHPQLVLIGGGVSANKLLRSKLSSLNVPIVLPLVKYSGDNAAMIANYAYLINQNK